MSKYSRVLTKRDEIRFVVAELERYLQTGEVEVRWRRPDSTRSLESNAKMWAMLGDIAKQVVWHGVKLDAEDWKHVLSAGIKKQRAVPGIDGGFVVLGQRTSKMGVKEMAELIELAQHFGDSKQVQWSDPAFVAMAEAYAP